MLNFICTQTSVQKAASVAANDKAIDDHVVAKLGSIRDAKLSGGEVG